MLFSHGLGGTREGNAYLGQHWSGRGYTVVFLQHPGSDDTVWKDQPLAKRMAAMDQAASAKNFLLRAQDVRRVLDQLDLWNKEKGHALAGRLDLTRVGMSGHSFGAVTTQAVSGQSVPFGGQRYTDPRIRAAIALSPSSPRRGDPATAFGAVKIPWLLMTGTLDTALIGDADVASRLRVYPNLPATIDKYELVLNGAEHSAFTDRALPGDRAPRNPNHHRAILAISTAFWDTYLRDDAAAPRGCKRLARDPCWSNRTVGNSRQVSGGIPGAAARWHTPASRWSKDGRSGGRRSHGRPSHRYAVPLGCRLSSAPGTSIRCAPVG